MDTLNNKAVSHVTRAEAIAYCHEHKDTFIKEIFADVEEGIQGFESLVSLLEDKTIDPIELPEYGMSDQELGLRD